MDRGRMFPVAAERGRGGAMMLGASLLAVLSILISPALRETGVCFGQQSSTDGPPSAEESDELMNELAEELDAAEQEGETSEAATAEGQESARQTVASSRKNQAKEQRDRLTKDKKWQPTHEQTDRIEVGVRLHNFCLDSKGRVLACCYDDKIRVYSQDGKLADTWELGFAPQAIGVRKSDGAVFAGGEGRLARLSPAGVVKQQEEFPRPMTDEEIEEAIQEQVNKQKEMYEKYLRGLKSQLAEVKKKIAKEPKSEKQSKDDKKNGQEDSADAESPLAPRQPAAFRYISDITATDDGFTIQFKADTPLAMQLQAIKGYIDLLDKQFGGAGKLEKQLRERMKRTSGTATFTGLAVADKDLFVIASAPGYSYNAWRTNHDMQDAKLIVKGLRGCCGQMDCQTYEGDLWIPMNTQHKVCRYDREGKLIDSFGKQGREEAEAFGGCCEPKNMRFSTDGYAYCAESGPPVCVKRFSRDGKFQDVACFPLYETGCVRVSVDLWDEKVFLLSPSENAIYVFVPKAG